MHNSHGEQNVTATFKVKAQGALNNVDASGHGIRQWFEDPLGTSSLVSILRVQMNQMFSSYNIFKFQDYGPIIFLVIVITHPQTDRQTDRDEYILNLQSKPQV